MAVNEPMEARQFDSPFHQELLDPLVLCSCCYSMIGFFGKDFVRNICHMFLHFSTSCAITLIILNWC